MSERDRKLRLTVTVPAELERLKLLTGIVHRCLCDGAGIGPERRDYQQLQLAIREACSNVIRHAYEGCDTGVLRLSLRFSGRGVFVKIEDRGVPMPVEKLRAAAQSKAPDPSELAEGGYGLGLIQETVDKVAYRRLGNGVNVVCLYKEFADAA